MNVLGIDTSCDDTAAAVVTDGRSIQSSVIASQQNMHATHGGVVPELAGRLHLENIRITVHQALADASLTLEHIDGIATTVGPGLAGSLVVGYNFGQALAHARTIPFIAVNHLEGHIYSAWLHSAGVPGPAPEFPVVVLIVSGGHTELLFMTGHGEYERLGGTLDDAAGEAFDKTGRLLGLSYPGGPAIQQAAADLPPSRAQAILPRAWLRGTYNFSFSGLKTAVLQMVKGISGPLSVDDVNAIAAGFQESVADILTLKTVAAAKERGARSVILCGGVAANVAVSTMLRDRLPRATPLFVPPLPLCTDNGAMIAGAGFFAYTSGRVVDAHNEVRPGLSL